ncbi:MAG: hypothetical protein FJW30_30370 [Acidobacteria bacterium]|nr:hypothetical protein [Acidobacteriota bacterium]
MLNPPAGVARLLDGLAPGAALLDAAAVRLWGSAAAAGESTPIVFEDAQCGVVVGAPGVAALVRHLLEKEAERRAPAAEVLHLYREIHLIEQLSEELAVLLDFSAVGQAALEQARRLIVATAGVVLLRDTPGAPFRVVASFGDPLGGWTHAIATAEITPEGVAAPLKATQRNLGVIALASPADPTPPPT